MAGGAKNGERRIVSRGMGFPRAAAIAVVLAAGLMSAAGASAATRYAAPGGTDTANSGCPQANPCSLPDAASRFAPGTTLETGDEIVVEPGSYDLGAQGILVKEGTSIHGVAGEPRPVITFTSTNGDSAFLMTDDGETLSSLEIITTGRSEAFSLNAPGTVDGVIARGNSDFEPCQVESGVVRDTACLSTGANGLALEVEPSSGQPNPVTLRNVTAIEAGANSVGLRVRASGPIALNVDAIGVIARGTSEDVLAGAFSQPPQHLPGTGATVTVSLDHSDFRTIKTESDAGGGVATITVPGSGTDIVAEPLLAADGYHELPGSPTIDAGAVDGSSGAADVDGERRVFGAAPDIGADEFQIPTATSLACAPASLTVGDSTACTATVSSSGPAPTGTVRFSSDGPGSFAAGACTLAPAGQGKASCRLAYTARAVGDASHGLTASYGGDVVSEPSQGGTSVRVLAKGQDPEGNRAAPNTTLKKKPPRRTASPKATFVFASSLAGSHFQCKLDRKPFKACRSPLRLKGLKRGRHALQVRAVSSAGVADPSPASFRWTVS